MPSWGPDLVNKLISISISIHESTHFILFALLKVHPRLACGPPKLMDPGAPPRLTPSQWACLCGTLSLSYIKMYVIYMTIN